MKRFAFLGVICALLLGALLFANHRRQQTPTYLLRHYAPSANLSYVIEQHTRPTSAVIFRSDWFNTDSNGSASGCVISNMGSGICQTYSENLTQNAGIAGIAPARILRFQTILRALPPGETAPPPLSRLLIVSFRDGTNWTTRLYDRARLPPQIIHAAKIGGFCGLQISAP